MKWVIVRVPHAWDTGDSLDLEDDQRFNDAVSLLIHQVERHIEVIVPCNKCKETELHTVP